MSDSSWTDNVEEVFAYHGEQEETFAKDAQPVVPGPAEGAPDMRMHVLSILNILSICSMLSMHHAPANHNM